MIIKRRGSIDFSPLLFAPWVGLVEKRKSTSLMMILVTYMDKGGQKELGTDLMQIVDALPMMVIQKRWVTGVVMIMACL